jgi:hypothetical protein
VDHIRLAESAKKRSGQAGSHGRKTLLVQSPDGFQFDTVKLTLSLCIELGTADVVTTAVVANHLMTLLGHAASQLFHHDLYAAFPGWDAFMSKHRNLHALNSLSVQLAA